jgi:DNA invertase Pin-like site-specific DNA recombinase
MSKIGYARVSRRHEDLFLQIDALKEAGIPEENLFIEQVAGNILRSERPQLERCLETLKTGDTLIVWRFDRLGRSLKDLIYIVQKLQNRGITFVALTEKVDTSSQIGSFFFEMINAFSQFEHNLISERTKEGYESAKRRGISGGRKNKLTPAQEKLLQTMYGEKKCSLLEIQEHFGITKPTIYRYLNRSNILSRNEKHKEKINKRKK